MVLFPALDYNRIVQIKQGFFLYWSTSVGWGVLSLGLRAICIVWKCIVVHLVQSLKDTAICFVNSKKVDFGILW